MIGEHFPQPSAEKADRVPESLSSQTVRKLLMLEKSLGTDERVAEELLDEIDSHFEELGAKREDDFDGYIHNVASDRIIVRRENPDALFDSIENHKPIQIGFGKSGEARPNASILDWDASGLRIPYSKGFAKVGDGKIVTVSGFSPNYDHMRVKVVPKEDGARYESNKEFDQTRMIEGEVSPDDIEFFIVRFPRKLFPESHMTDEELENENTFYISRAYSLKPAKEKSH